MIPTQRQIDLMDPRDRAQFPRAIRLTSSERKAADELKTERKLHTEVSGYLRLRKKLFQFVHADACRRSTIEPGWPDYTIICKIFTGGKSRALVCLIELKAPGGRLSEAQIKKFAELELAGIPVFICTSLRDVILQLMEYFQLPAEVFTND